MPLCPTAIIMGALTVGLVAADVWFLHADRVITHIFLGGITTALLYALCERGYESVNWIFLGALPLYIILAILYKLFKRSNRSYQRGDESTRGCNVCKVPKSSCSCVNNPPPPSNNCMKCNMASNSCACKNNSDSSNLVNYNSTSSNSVSSPQTEMPDPTPATREWYYNLNKQ